MKNRPLTTLFLIALSVTLLGQTAEKGLGGSCRARWKQEGQSYAWL